VSAPFSLLGLILLTDFHKNASFRPSMLNYLNTTFTFGKQTKNNFINRKVQCRSTYSFLHSFSCQLFSWKSGGDSSPRWTRNTSRATAISDTVVLLAPHQNGIKQGRRCSHATSSLDELWAALTWVQTVARKNLFAMPSWDIPDTWPN